MNINLEIDGGEALQVEAGILVKDLLEKIGKVDPDVLGVRMGNDLLDWQTSIQSGGKLKVIRLSEDSADARHFYRHSFSHVLAQAVRRIFPGAKLAIGPATAEGFYYDFDVEKPFTPEDLDKIAAEMEKIVGENHHFERKSVSSDEAISLLEKAGEIYKLELVNEFAGRGEKLSFYQDWEYIDL